MIKGIALVAAHEFRIRVRTGRWQVLLLIWLVVVSGFTVLVDINTETGYGNEADDAFRGVPLFGIVMFFVLGIMLVISPTFTAQGINGDRERGTLATLQVTRLSPVEIALGKLLAGWGVGLVALALTLPAVAYSYARGGLPAARVAGCYGVVALLIGVICALSLAYSALVPRSITSSLLAYLTVVALSIGTLIAFWLAGAFVREEVHVDQPEYGGGYTYERTRTEDIWWLMAPNPFVVVADAAPSVPPRVTRLGEEVYVQDYDVLSSISRGVRDLRVDRSDYYADYVPGTAPVWPWGLGFNLLLGAGAVAVTIARLRTPAHRLAKGVRLA